LQIYLSPQATQQPSSDERLTLGQINQVRLGWTDTPQQHNLIATDDGGAQLLAEIQQPPALDVKDSQLGLLIGALIIDIFNLQTLGSGVQDASDDPVFRVEEGAGGEFRRRGGRLGLDGNVDAILGRHLLVPLGRLLQRVDGHQARRGRRRLRLGQDSRGHDVRLLSGTPGLQLAKGGAGRLGLGIKGGGGGTGPDGDQVLAVVVLPETVLEAVIAITGGAVHRGGQTGADGGFADGRGARLLHICPHLARAQRRLQQVCLPPARRPFACLGTDMPGLRAVVEAEGAAAGFAAEGEEVELIAVGILTMHADQGRVFFVNHGEGCAFGRFCV
jgi:hypothetical protein